MTTIIASVPRFSLMVNGETVGYTGSGIVLDYTSRRVRGCAVSIDGVDPFCALLRRLNRGEIINLSLVTSSGEVDFHGSAEVVMIREKFNRRIAPGVSFIFKMLP